MGFKGHVTDSKYSYLVGFQSREASLLWKFLMRSPPGQISSHNTISG